jgi:hypothetical protein
MASSNFRLAAAFDLVKTNRFFFSISFSPH